MNSIFRARTGLSTVLFTIFLLGAFASSFAVDALNYADNISPLTFGGDAKSDSTKWAQLKKYKLWATGESGNPAITIEGNGYIHDSIGYTGSAKGDLNFINDHHYLGGPILIAGSFNPNNGVSASTGPDSIFSNDAYFGGSFTVGYNNGGENEYRGNFHVKGDYPNGLSTGDIGGKNHTFDHNTTQMDVDLDVPHLGNAKYDVDLQEVVVQNKNEIRYIDVPETTSRTIPYTIHITKLALHNDSKLCIRMSRAGRLTRIVADTVENLTNDAEIRVVYADSPDEWDAASHVWKTVFEPAIDTAYSGDLLFYTPKGIIFDAGNEQGTTEEAKKRYKTIHGSYISGGTIRICQGMNFNGQLLAKKIVIDHHFMGNFTFTPYGQEIDIKALIDGSFKEGDGETSLLFKLNSMPTNVVRFRYCIQFDDKADPTAKKDPSADSVPAHKSDFENPGPICISETNNDVFEEVVFYPNHIEPSENKTMIPVDDDIVENKEYFFIRIFNVEGAILSNSGEDYGTYQLFIYDNDKEDDKPETHDTTVVSTIIDNSGKKDTIGYEDVAFAITKFPAYKYVRFETTEVDGEVTKIIVAEEILKDYKVVIVDLPKGILTYNGKAVNAGDIIPSEDLAKGLLTYKGQLNEYGEFTNSFAYDTLEFKIVNGANLASDAKKMKIAMLPVNDPVKIVHLDASRYSDKNIVKKDTLKVDEDAVVGAVVGHAWALDTADANHQDKLDTVKYTFEKSKTTLKANEKDITEAFEIDRLTGDITVKKALDFETIHTYKGRVIATDNGVPGNRGAVLADTFDFVIELNDVDEEIETHDSTIHTMTITGVSGKDTLIGYEDVTFPVLNSFFPAYKTARIVTKEKDGQKTDEQNTIYETPITDFRVVVEAPSKGSLTYFGHKVTEKDTIPSDSLKAGMLKYTSELNEFGDSTQKFEKYASFKFRLFYKDKSMPSKTKTMFVDMTPVNDAPEIVYLNVGKPDVSKTDKNIIKNNTFSVEEDATAGSVVGYAFAIDTADSKHNSPTTLKYSLGKSLETLKGGEKQVTDAFEIDAKTGAITLKNGAALDYDKDSIYHGQVIVTDNGVPGNRDAKFFLKDSIALTIVLEKGPAKTDVITVHDTIIIGTDGKNIYRGYEDIEFPIDSFPAFKRVVNIKTKGTDGKIIAEETYESLVDYSVKIESVSKGTLMYKGQKVDLKNALIVPSKDVKAGLLTFKGLQDEFGDSAKAYVYAELKFSILRDGAKKYSETKTMKIVVKPMNDKPIMENVSLVVSDDNPIGKVVGGVKAKDEVDSKYDDGDKLTYKIAPVEKLGDGEKDFSEAFEIDSKTGDIKVIKTLDYHLDSVYVGRVVATDNGVPGDRDPKKFLSTSAEIRIKLVLGNRTPSTKDTIIVSKITDSGDAIGYEDIAFSITRFPAYEDYKLETEKKDGKVVVIDTILVNPLDDYDITITRLPTKGSLTLDGKAVKPGDVISSDDLKKGLLKYKGLPNDFGKIADSFMYDSLSFAILYEEHVSIAKLIKFQMKPVNDKPEVTTKNFTIAENISVGAVAVTVVAQDSVDMNRDAEATLTYKFEAVKDLKDGEQDAMSVFEIDSKTGEVKLNKALDYYQDSIYHGIVVVTDNGVPGDRKNTLSDIADIYIKLVAGLRAPVIQNDTFYVAENSPAKTLVGKIVAHDVEDDDADLVIGLLGSSNEFVVASDGKITVKQGAVLDYETKREYTLKVNVKDSDGLTADGSIVILIDDVREPATLNDTIFHVPENVSKGHVVGVVVPNNPNKNTLKFKIVTDNDKFKIRDDGTIITNGDIDYEKQKVYKLKVVMDDDGDKDTATVTINVDNVEERSVVKITRADDGDTLWLNPDTIYTNKHKIDFEWTLNGKLRPDSIVEYSKDGTYLFSVCETDPSMDLPGCDTAIVKIDNSIPKVRISKSAEDMSAITGVTIVEQVDKNDTNFYVNHEDNIVTVGITDKGMGVDSTFTVQLRLDTLKNTKNVQEKIKKISKTEITLDDAEKAQTKRTKVDDDTYEVTFKKLVGDDMVTVTYYTDKNGDAIRDLDGNAFMKVTYDTELNGEPIKVSYNVDADNGKIVENENGGRYEYYYSYVDKFGGLVGVSYNLDEKGKFAKTDAGDLGYQVSYTYKNRYGNSATKNISVVVDKIVPQVKILSPEDKYVSRVSGVDVKWVVDDAVQDTLVIQALKTGANKVIRTYRDKAGNESSDTVEVYLKAPKELNVHVEKPVTIVNEDSVRKYYDNNPPEKGQSFAVSMYNPYADKEVETLIGGTFGKKKGGQKEVYDGMEGHLGPTLLIDALAPRCGDKTAGGLCTLDDIIERDGKISLEAGGGWDRKKVSVDEYVEQYCSDDFRKDYKNDPAKASLYNTRIRVTIWIYTNIGGFLDEYSFTQEVNDPDFVSEIGEVEMAFEMKPDMDGNVLSAKGRLLGTGAYIFNTEVKSVSELRCKLPSEEIGHKRVLTDTLRKPFGYKRPSLSKGKKK